MRKNDVSSLPFYAEKSDSGCVVPETLELLFESQAKVTDFSSDRPIYLANIPMNGADPELDPIQLLDKIREEIFFDNDLSVAEREKDLSRLSVVIGINRRMSLIDESRIPTFSQ